MKNLKILNSKGKKEFLKDLEKIYGYVGELDYTLFEAQDKFIIARDITDIELEKLRIYSLGIILCDKKKEGLVLTIEGTQILGKKCDNIIEISKNDIKSWLFGNDIKTDDNKKGIIIIRSGNDFLGCGYSDGKTIKNLISKERRSYSEE